MFDQLQEMYASNGVNVEAAIVAMVNAPMSLHCWQDDDGLTLSHFNSEIRAFWIEYCKRSRIISAAMGEQLGSFRVMNLWGGRWYRRLPAETHHVYGLVIL